jgi:hypothetical protein
MKRLLLASISIVPLVGCYAGERRATGKCPAGETCSDVTPTGLDFIGNRLVDQLLLSGPLPTAVGGTQVVALEYDRGDGVDVALDMPYTADDDGGIGVKVSATSGSQVTMLGMGSRTNYLRILDSDGLLMDRKELTGAALKSMEIVTADYESISADRLLAFNIGQRDLGVALYGDVQSSSGPASRRLVDTSMELGLTSAQRTAWDTLRIDLDPGTYPLTITAGDKPANTLDVVVVDHADSLSVMSNQPTTIVPNQSRSVCFEALTGTRYIAGLSWAFDIDGASKIQGDGSLQRNCVSVSTTKTSGTVNVLAMAGGHSATVSLTVALAREAHDATAPVIRPLPSNITTAGDRAAM